MSGMYPDVPFSTNKQSVIQKHLSVIRTRGLLCFRPFLTSDFRISESVSITGTQKKSRMSDTNKI